MGMNRRSILLIIFKLFDSTLLVSSFLAASIASSNGIRSISLTEFLAMRTSIRNFVLFTALVLLWHALFSFLDLYESKRLWGQQTEALDVLEATSLSTLTLYFVGALFIPESPRWERSNTARRKTMMLDAIAASPNASPMWASQRSSCCCRCPCW